MKLDQIQVEKRLLPKMADDGRHLLRQTPLARESVGYPIVLPDEQLTIFIYSWVDAYGKAGSLCCLYGPAVGKEGHILEFQDGIAVPPNMDFDDWRVGGLHLRQSMTLETADFTYSGKRVGVEARFEAMHPAYLYGGHRDGCPAVVADDRFEQSGMVSGSVMLDGRRMPFHIAAHRDHSWGSRDWPAIQHWRWFEGQAGPDFSIHFYEIHSAGLVHLRGYIYNNGKMSEITSVDFKYESDLDLTQKSFEAVVRDTEGRVVKVRGQVFAHFAFPVRADTIMNETGVTIEFDGIPGAGWLEMCWPKSYVDYMAQRIA